jgi:hypothetical protein
MTLDELREIETYCPEKECGDPVGGLSRSRQFTRRRLVFRGFQNSIYAKYKCPACPFTRLFRVSLLGGHAVELEPKTAGREVRSVVIALLLLVLGLWVMSSVKQCNRERARKTAREERTKLIETIREITPESFDIRVERAEVFEERQLRVLLAARLREKQDETYFLPPEAYFLDQEGTRYDASPTLVADKAEDPAAHALEAPGLVKVVPGQVHRYYLLAPILRSPHSNAAASQRVKRIVMHMTGYPPQEIVLTKAGE